MQVTDCRGPQISRVTANNDFGKMMIAVAILTSI